MGDPLAGDYPAAVGIYDAGSRQAKADKILAILRAALGDRLASCRCLDIGCASGLITRGLAPHLRWAIGLEYDPQAVARMDATGADNLLFLQGDAAHLPLPDDAVDLVVCAQVYEHVGDAQALAAEVERVLRPGGVCFFSGPNRLDPIERHYGLPFVSWLPRPLADAYLRGAPAHLLGPAAAVAPADPHRLYGADNLPPRGIPLRERVWAAGMGIAAAWLAAALAAAPVPEL
mgnify:CR=1 FL=1